MRQLTPPNARKRDAISDVQVYFFTCLLCKVSKPEYFRLGRRRRLRGEMIMQRKKEALLDSTLHTSAS